MSSENPDCHDCERVKSLGQLRMGLDVMTRTVGELAQRVSDLEMDLADMRGCMDNLELSLQHLAGKLNAPEAVEGNCWE